MAVIAPPYFALDERALQAHFEAAAAACAPLPFYVYEFEARAGYAVPIALIERLREQAPNLQGLKVSDKPWEKLEPYLLEGLDVFVGAEALVARGLERGAAGAVSGLAFRRGWFGARLRDGRGGVVAIVKVRDAREGPARRRGERGGAESAESAEGESTKESKTEREGAARRHSHGYRRR